MKIQSVILALTVLCASFAGAILVEKVATAAGQSEAHADAGSGSGVGSGSAVTPPSATTPPTATPTANVDDPQAALEQGIQFARTGKGRVAFGFGLVLFVWGVRKFLKPRLPWFGTKAGGYTLGFGSAGILYLGGGLIADMPITANLLGDAFSAALAAGGGWEALLDVVGAVKKSASIAGTTGASILITFVGVYLLTATASGCTHVKTASTALIDCTKAESQAAIDDLTGDLSQLVDGTKPSWSSIYAQAEAHGANIGGCALASFVQSYLAPPAGRMAPPASAGHEAQNALETFRSKVAGGATFHTATADL